MENATSSSNMAPLSNFVWPIVTTVDSQTLKSSPDSEKKNLNPFLLFRLQNNRFFFLKITKEISLPRRRS